MVESLDEGLIWRYLGIVFDEEWYLFYLYVFEYEGEVIFGDFFVFVFVYFIVLIGCGLVGLLFFVLFVFLMFCFLCGIVIYDV